MAREEGVRALEAALRHAGNTVGELQRQAQRQAVQLGHAVLDADDARGWAVPAHDDELFGHARIRAVAAAGTCAEPRSSRYPERRRRAVMWVRTVEVVRPKIEETVLLEGPAAQVEIQQIVGEALTIDETIEVLRGRPEATWGLAPMGVGVATAVGDSEDDVCGWQTGAGAGVGPASRSQGLSGGGVGARGLGGVVHRATNELKQFERKKGVFDIAARVLLYSGGSRQPQA